MKNWLSEVFNCEKPIIAMCHLRALPGDPGFDKVGGMKAVVECARRDLIALQEGGVDGVMFSNEFSLPYLTRVRTETTAAMARVIGELINDIHIPYGVNVLWDPIASLDLAAAVDAQFIREIISGVYASDFGLWNTSSGETVRHKHAIGAGKVKLFYNIYPEAASYLGCRDIESITKTTLFNCLPDALCVSGATAGSATDPEILSRAKDAAGDTVVFANTGCKVETIESILNIADGAIVATTFKYDGIFENAVDPTRVKVFMSKVMNFRNTHR